MSDVLLSVENVTLAFEGLVAVDDVSFQCERGELFGVIGPNGAGKTTLLNCISGLHSIRRGRIILEDHPIQGLLPHKIAQLGVGRTFQAAEVFNEFRVVDYLLTGRMNFQQLSLFACGLSMPKVIRSERSERQRARSMLEEFQVGSLAEMELRSLSYGMRKLIDLLRALMMEPRLLLLDEPTSGTAMEDREVLRDVLATANASGVTIVVVDHDVKFIADACGRIIVMNFGQELGIGEPSEVLRRPEVIEAYIGIEVTS